MSKVIGIAILLILGFAGWRFAAYYREVNRQVEQRNNRWEQTSTPAESPGMSPALEPLLAAAKTKGASEFKKWLRQYRRYVSEPRLSEIELDYVVMVGRSDPEEARRVFANVQKRNGKSSPLADRIQKLAKTYQ